MEIRGKMNRADRAKQFMPFDALKGFREALREKEKIIVSKIDLSEETKAVLNYKLQQINRNDIVTIVYFYRDEYLKITGMVSRIDITARVLKIVNTKINFEDIYDIQGDALGDRRETY